MFFNTATQPLHHTISRVVILCLAEVDENQILTEIIIVALGKFGMRIPSWEGERHSVIGVSDSGWSSRTRTTALRIPRRAAVWFLLDPGKHFFGGNIFGQSDSDIVCILY